MNLFFHTIRKRLLSENLFRKYLVYAIGEIIIIVVGIFLAVQVNNWNENNKKDKLEIQILGDIENGLKKDLLEAKSNLSYQKNILENQMILIKWLENNLNFNDSLLPVLQKSLLASTFFKSEGPYETLKGFGFNSMKNNDLKNKIIDLYDVRYPYYVKLVDEYIEQMKNTTTTISQYVTEYNFLLNENTMKPINMVQMKTDQEFLYQFKTLKNYNKGVIYQTNRLIQRIESTIEEIEKELQKRK